MDVRKICFDYGLGVIVLSATTYGSFVRGCEHASAYVRANEIENPLNVAVSYIESLVLHGAEFALLSSLACAGVQLSRDYYVDVKKRFEKLKKKTKI